MSVVGIDLGNFNSVVAVARNRGIDVLANEASNRDNPVVVSFKQNQRVMGESAAMQEVGNIRNSIRNFKRFLGKRFESEEAQREMGYCPFKVVPTADGLVGFEVDYSGSTQVFSAEQITAMYLAQMVNIAEKETKTKATDVVVSVPGHFTDGERRALYRSAEIAGINCLQLISEPIAIGTAQTIYKKDLPKEESNAVKTMFIDLGQSTLSVFIASISDGRFKILAAGYDRNLGGRDFDDLIVSHFLEEIKQKHKMDVSTNPKSLKRLRDACEKVKNIFTTNPETVLSVESLMNDVDVRSKYTREEFEALCPPLLSRVSALVQKVLAESTVSLEDIPVVEMLGNASRIQCVQSTVQQIFPNALIAHTANKSECVAKGAAIQAAILSPNFRINKDWIAKDCLPYTVQARINITKAASNSNDMEVDSEEPPSNLCTFARGSQTPSFKKVTFKGVKTVEVEVSYADQNELPPSVNPQIARYSMTIPEPSADAEGPIKLEVKFGIDKSGLFVLDYAKVVETYSEVTYPKITEVQATPAPASPSAAETPAPSGSESAGEAASKPDASPEQLGEEAKPAEGAKAAEEAKPEPVIKKKLRRSDLHPHVELTNGVSSHIIAELQKKELEMRSMDQLAIATAASKNLLESFVYDFRSKIQFEGCELYDYCTEEERESLNEKLNALEDWLYGDGEDTTKVVYDTKLTEIRAAADPIELRYTECEQRPAQIEALKNTLEKFQSFATSSDEKYAHIDQAERDKVLNECKTVSEWLQKMTERQEALAKHQDPVLLSSELKNKNDQLVRICNPIMNKKPPPPPAKAAEPAPAAPAKEDETNKQEPAAEEKKSEEAPKSQEQGPSVADMDLD